jgi:hypothetical protein
MSFNLLLSECLTEKLSLFRVTGVVSMRSSTPLPKLVYHIKSRVLIRINRMVLLKESIDIL